MTCYHLLVIDTVSMPSCDKVMAISHRFLTLEGVQFHPERIFSEQRHQLLANFLRL